MDKNNSRVFHIGKQKCMDRTPVSITLPGNQCEMEKGKEHGRRLQLGMKKEKDHGPCAEQEEDLILSGIFEIRVLGLDNWLHRSHWAV